MLVPLLGSLPSIDLFGVSSGYNGYGQVSCYITSWDSWAASELLDILVRPIQRLWSSGAKLCCSLFIVWPCQELLEPGRRVQIGKLIFSVSSLSPSPPSSFRLKRARICRTSTAALMTGRRTARPASTMWPGASTPLAVPAPSTTSSTMQWSSSIRIESNYKLRMLLDQTPDTRHKPMDWIKPIRTNFTKFLCINVVTTVTNEIGFSNRISLIITMRQQLNYDDDFYFLSGRYSDVYYTKN